MRHQLSAEADPEHPDAGGHGGAYQLDLSGNPRVGQPFVVDRPPGTQGHDDVVAGRIWEGDVEDWVIGSVRRHHIEGADIEARFGERFG